MPATSVSKEKRKFKEFRGFLENVFLLCFHDYENYRKFLN
jgi:hypothetical protein